MAGHQLSASPHGPHRHAGHGCPCHPDDLTNEQREALSAFRDAVGDEVPGLGGFGGRDGHHGRGGFGRGGGAPGDATEGAPGTPDATEEATVQESALVTT